MRLIIKFIILRSVLLTGIFASAQTDFSELNDVLKNDTIPLEDRGFQVQAEIKTIHDHPEIKYKILKDILPIISQYNEPTYYWHWNLSYNLIIHEFGKDEEAVKHAYKMLEYAEKVDNSKWKGDAYVCLYKVHQEMGLREKAKSFVNRANQNFKKAQDYKNLANTSYLLGYTYYSLGSNDSAIFHLQNATDYVERINEDYYTHEYNYLLARTHIRVGNYDKAIAILKYVVATKSKVQNEYYSKYYSAGSKMYIAQAFARKKEMDSASYYFDLCKKEYREFDMDLFKIAHFYTAGEYMNVDEYKNTLPLIEYLEDSADFYQSKLLAARTYSGLGMYDSAIDYYEASIKAIDSINTFEKAEMLSILDQNSQGELEIQKQIDEEKRIATEIKAASERNQKFIILIGAAIVGVLILFFGLILFKRYKVIKEQKEEINLQKLQVEEKNSEILGSIAYAKRIQDAILPPLESFKHVFPKSFVLYKPKDVVAGDFYWFEKVDNIVLFAVADCTGHGVPGAMVSVVCNNALNRSVREFGLRNPNFILDKTRELVIETFEKSADQVKDGMDIALCAVNLDTFELEFSGANNPLYHINDGELNEIKGDKQPIGLYDLKKPFKVSKIQLEKGDGIYLGSDGYSDQFGGDKGKKFKYKNFRGLLVKYQDEPSKKQMLLLDTAFERWRGEIEQVDDVCVLGIKI
ncbi:MAG: SpoIIE family protein phosphatase [Crocinitomicaceae bacterium]